MKLKPGLEFELFKECEQAGSKNSNNARYFLRNQSQL